MAPSLTGHARQAKWNQASQRMRVKLRGVTSSAESAAQHSPGRGREAAEALGWGWVEKSPEGAIQVARGILLRPFKAPGFKVRHDPGLTPWALLRRPIGAPDRWSVRMTGLAPTGPSGTWCAPLCEASQSHALWAGSISLMSACKQTPPLVSNICAYNCNMAPA